MTIFTATLTTTAMLLATLGMFSLNQISFCAGRRWEAEVRRVGEGLKDEARLTFPVLCRGPQVRWNFKGHLHD